MEYKTFNEKDFIADEFFQQWVWHPDVESNRFWEDFLENHPEMGPVVTSARSALLLLSDEQGAMPARVRMEIVDSIREHMDAETTQGVHKLKKDTGLRPLYMVSGLIVVMGLAVLWMYNFGVFTDQAVAGPPQITLQLQDGTEQVIDEGDTRTITTETGQPLGNQEKHLLKYHNTQHNATELVYNELKVPYGKNFELVLADGSHIYLNAGSTLRYPVQFLPDGPRDVYLMGEAFFDVASDKTRPFTVHTDQMNTQVYGTRFNVTSYTNEGNTYTVLEEGSVGVYPPGADVPAPVKIVPGQRAVMENGSIAVEAVRVEKYVAWTRGELYFRNDPFALILKKLERHFNVSITSSYPELDQMEFIGTFKGQTLDEILSAFQEYTPFQYKREGNKITIAPLH